MIYIEKQNEEDKSLFKTLTDHKRFKSSLMCYLEYACLLVIQNNDTDKNVFATQLFIHTVIC